MNNFIQRFSVIHHELPNRIQTMPCLVEERLEYIMLHEPFISTLYIHSQLMTPVHPTETCWRTFTENENTLNSTILRPWWNHVGSRVKSTARQRAWGLAYINSIVTLNAKPTPGFFEGALASKYPYQFFNEVKDEFLAHVKNGQQRMMTLLTAILASPETHTATSPLWFMPLLDVLCVLEVIARYAFEPNTVPTNNGGDGNEQARIGFVENVIRDMQRLAYQENTPLLEAPPPPGTIELLLAIMDVIPENAKFFVSQEILENLTNEVLLGRVKTPPPVQHYIGNGPERFQPTMGTVPKATRNLSINRLERALHAIEQRDPEILHTLSGNNSAHPRRFALTRTRLTLHQHAAQSVAYAHAAQKAMEVSIENGTHALNADGNEKEMNLTEEQKECSQHIPSALSQIVSQPIASHLIHACFQDPMFIENTPTVQGKLNIVDHNTFSMLNSMQRVLIEMGLFISREMFNEFRNNIIEDIKWVFVYRQQSCTNPDLAVSFDNFLRLYTQIYYNRTRVGHLPAQIAPDLFYN